MTGRLSLVFLGLSISSSWGNGHATNYRALLKALHARGHDVTFLERNRPWYADNRDLSRPSFCDLRIYERPADLTSRFRRRIARADAVILGSYVPDGSLVADIVLNEARGLVGFYDIDTPVTLRRLDGGDTEYVAADQVGAFDFYLSFSGGPCLERLRDEYGARNAVPFYCMVDPDTYGPSPQRRLWDVGYLGTFSPDRQAALERLLIEPARRLPDRRFVVAGPQYPADIAWPPNVDRIDHVAPADHPAFYGRLGYALNLTRAEMAAAGWSPSVRVFEAAACETPILTDSWIGLDRVLPAGEAIEVVRDASDVFRLVEDACAARAGRLARRARQIVLSGHTGTRRAQELEAVLRKARVSQAYKNEEIYDAAAPA